MTSRARRPRRVDMRKAKSKRSWVRRIFKGLLFTGALGILAGLLVFVATYILLPIPKPSQLALAQTTKVYYADGQTLMGEFSEVNRTIIDTSTLPKYIGEAVIASEDQQFYSNNGIDFKGILRAFINNISGGARQGASTLTQQYVDNYYSGSETGYIGKIRESILAIKINNKVSKQEILDSYLNTIYFGRGAYGIQAGAQAFFGVDADKLDISQAALLAGIIPAPSAWDPAVDEEFAKKRWSRVLNAMVANGYLDKSERDKLQFPETVQAHDSNTYAGTKGYLLSHVRAELDEMADIDNNRLKTGGFKIVTTIDPAKQQAAEDAVASLPADKPDGLKVALISVNPTNGAIEAEYGGADYLKVQQNAVTDDYVMPGSTFKPFTLLYALENGENLNNRYPGYSPMTIDGYTVKNYGNYSYGNMTLLSALVNSANTPFVSLNSKIGPKNTMDTLIDAGIPEDTPDLAPVLSNVLGSAAVHPIDLAKAYVSIASGGRRFEPYIVSRVSDYKGNVVYKSDDPGELIFTNENAISELTYAMSQVVAQGHAGDVSKIRRPIAAKTGTSEDNKSALFSGWVPQLYTLVALYQSGPNGEQLPITPFGGYKEIYGENMPAKLWANYMNTLFKDMPVEQFPKRPKTISSPSPSSRRGSNGDSDTPQVEYEITYRE